MLHFCDKVSLENIQFFYESFRFLKGLCRLKKILPYVTQPTLSFFMVQPCFLIETPLTTRECKVPSYTSFDLRSDISRLFSFCQALCHIQLIEIQQHLGIQVKQSKDVESDCDRNDNFMSVNASDASWDETETE